jgi:hypothetical protein
MESVMFIELPTRFHHAGNLAITGQLTEADTANLETTDIGVASTAVLTTVILPRTEFRRPTLLYFPSYFRHSSIL